MGFIDQFQQFFRRLRTVKPQDILAVFPAAAAAAAAPFFRMRHRRIWLICERRSDARDNGYRFYQYVRRNHPEIEAVYAIDPQSPDYEKVSKLGKVIRFGSFSHWLHYFAAERNISSQKEGKPNAALCFVLEVYLNRVRNRVFLQHGITQSDLRWLYHDMTRMSLFTCGARREYAYVKEKFGYPPEAVQLTGLCRFDHLPVRSEPKRQVLVMPTMRRWLTCVSSDTDRQEISRKFTDSEYFLAWTGFLASAQLAQLLDAYDANLVFCPHAAIQPYLGAFASCGSRRITIADAKSCDVQELLISSALMVTDYSSVHFDFAYMGKPVIYYQFDHEKFRRVQYQQGYFSYQEDGFGPVVTQPEQLLQSLEDLLKNQMRMPQVYRDRAGSFFAFRDTDNCRRVFEAVCAMDVKK